MIANLDQGVPLIADVDTGYGGPNMVRRTIAQYARSGVADCHIEDQIQTKRCGHLAGKQLVPLDVFEQRIRAAAAARYELRSDIVLVARTDALQTHGFNIALERLEAAIRAGADVVFLEGVRDKQQARELCRRVAPTPVLLNMVENGATPSWSVDEAKDLGFRIIILPFAAIAPAYEAIRSAYRRIKDEGVTGIDPSFTPKRLFTIVGLEKATAVDDAAGGNLYDMV
ncbi:Methylisocitrate lyase [Escovopsis weberi]|uniref:Methylisocitrate lyase n=1 Tax=Escovopsis weberi TaxID=150374 RepID=A0A0M8MTQ0_ESCWE|nr:Methylisocitrate lyase [Escovopsis weberi]